MMYPRQQGLKLMTVKELIIELQVFMMYPRQQGLKLSNDVFISFLTECFYDVSKTTRIETQDTPHLHGSTS